MVSCIDISGKFRYKAILTGQEGIMKLPGSSCEAKIGKKQEYADEFSREIVRAPREAYEYIGPLELEREIEIPSEWKDKNVYLYLERVNLKSSLYFDGIKVGRDFVGLSTPHIYKLTDRVDPKGKRLIEDVTGKHTIKIVTDNSDILNLGDMASGYSVDTQGYWNGVIGEMKLFCDEIYGIENVKVFYRNGHLDVETITVSDRHMPMKTKPATLSVKLSGPDGEEYHTSTKKIELFTTRQRNRSVYSLKAVKKRLWSEFDPVLYSLTVTLKCEGHTSEKTVKFGMRSLKVKDKYIYLNDKPLYLRGTVNCAQFPKTGYPAMDKEIWLEHLKAYKEYGLNHVRFHCWCPPEAAFEAADELGMYILAESPLWLNYDISPMEFGDDEWHRLYFREEAIRISDTYGNHPSFIMFSNGNENMGDYAELENITTMIKALDDRRLYTISSNFDHPIHPCEDYENAFEINHKRVRIQTRHDEVAVATDANYDYVNVSVPYVSFEVGQYCVYPNVDEIKRYDKNVMAVNLDIIKKMMIRHGVYHRLKDYIKASGMLAYVLYKEDVEAALRSEKMNGFQLLAIIDYTGQRTATVGLLNIFHENKGIISREDWRQFCSERVVLFEAKRIFKIGDTLEGNILLYDAGETKIEAPVYEVSIFRLSNDADRELIHKETVKASGKRTPFEYKLDKLKENTELLVDIKLANQGHECHNTWRIFVFADNNEEVNIIQTPEEYDAATKKGGKYIASLELFSKLKERKLSDNRFKPVFWSPVHFPSDAPCGAIIKADSPLFNSFPTQGYVDYQWKYLMDHSKAVDITGLEDIDAVFEPVPNFVDNVPKSSLFVSKEGRAELVWCGFEYDEENLESKALFSSLNNYINN